MGWKQTIYLKRETMRQDILAELYNLSPDELREVMDEIPGEQDLTSIESMQNAVVCELWNLDDWFLTGIMGVIYGDDETRKYYGNNFMVERGEAKARLKKRKHRKK